MQVINGVEANRVPLGNPKVYHLPSWDDLSDPKRLDVIAQIIDQYGRDPRIAETCIAILREAGVKPRDYLGQQAALLKWVQDNIYYVNEPGERLQSPIYTLNKGFGDCDDLIILLLSFYHCLGFSWRLVISGIAPNGSKIRWVHGDGRVPKGDFTHIYGAVGNMPFNPTEWHFVEPTLQGAPFGWDVVSAKGNYLPEMGGGMGAVDFGGFIPSFAAPAPSGVGIGVGTSTAMQMEGSRRGMSHYMRETFVAVIIAVASTVLSELWLEKIRKKNATKI